MDLDFSLTSVHPPHHHHQHHHQQPQHHNNHRSTRHTSLASGTNCTNTNGSNGETNTVVVNSSGGHNGGNNGNGLSTDHHYYTAIKDLISNGEVRLIVNINSSDLMEKGAKGQPVSVSLAPQRKVTTISTTTTSLGSHTSNNNKNHNNNSNGGCGGGGGRDSRNNSHNNSHNNNTSSSSGRSSKNSSSKSHRYETSLGQLTKKFVGLLRDSADGLINLNEASSLLEVQKRRIYDITNVLEGVGLLQKTSKNNIRWSGGNIDAALADPPPHGSAGKSFGENYRNQLEMDVARLDAKEKQLDELLQIATAEIQSSTDQCGPNKPHTYVTYRDLRCIKEFANQTIIAIKAPSDTKLEVPDPRESLQIWLKSDRGEIEVYLCPEDDTCPSFSSSSGQSPSKTTTTNSNSIAHPHGSKCGSSSSSSAKCGPQIEEPTSDEGKGTSLFTEMESNIKTEVKSEFEETGLRYAFISEEDDMAPMSSRSYLMQTEDQTNSYIKMMHNYNMSEDAIGTSGPLGSGSSLVDLPFLHLEPSLSDIYSFALEESEGIGDLFD